MRLTETNVFEAADTDSIDDGLIRNVKIVGLTSRNRRRYPMRVLKEAAHKYEDKPVNINHHRGAGDRDANDGFGWLQSVRVVENGPSPGLYGDLRFLTSHPFAARLKEAADKRPQMYGLSHDVDAATKGQEVTNIDHVYCVDLVKDPGATTSLFESDETQDRIREIDMALPTQDLDSDPMLGAVRALMDAVLNGGDDSDEMRRKINVILRMKDKLMNQERTMASEQAQESVQKDDTPEKVDKVETPAENTGVMEKIEESVASLTARVEQLASDVLFDAVIKEQNIDPLKLSDEQQKDLRSCRTRESMLEAAEKLPPAVRIQETRSVATDLFRPAVGSYDEVKAELGL